MIWREIVDTMPDGWFNPGVQPVLRCLCSHIATSEYLAARIILHRNQNNLEKLNYCTQMLERESKAVGELSSKLRLTPKSKWGQEKASHLQKLNSKKRPWNAKAA